MTRQLALPFVHTPRFDDALFIVASSNADAVALLDNETSWPQARLAIWGGEGRGKTHLLHRWAGRRGARLLQGEHLTLAPPAGASAIDDADLADEPALLHHLNASAEAGFPVLIASRAAPARWAVRLPDLASRLRAMLAVEIAAPDDALLRGLFTRLLTDRHLPVAEPLRAYLLARLPRTAAALREATAVLDRLCLEARARPSHALAARVVAEITGEGSDAVAGSFDDDPPFPLAAGSHDASLLL